MNFQLEFKCFSMFILLMISLRHLQREFKLFWMFIFLIISSCMYFQWELKCFQCSFYFLYPVCIFKRNSSIFQCSIISDLHNLRFFFLIKVNLNFKEKNCKCRFYRRKSDFLSKNRKYATSKNVVRITLAQFSLEL